MVSVLKCWVVQCTTRRMSCTLAVEVLLFSCNWLSKEVFYLWKLYHLTDTTVKWRRLTFPEPSIQHCLCLLLLTFFFLFLSFLVSFAVFNFRVYSYSSALILSCLLLIQPVCPLVNSSDLTLSYLTTNEQCGCARSQRIRNPHGNPIILYHNTVLISLETTSFSWETA